MLRRILSFVALNLFCLTLAHAGALCFGDAQVLRCLDTDSNAVVRTLPQPGVVALTLNRKDSTLWALTSGQLFKYDVNGAPLLNLDLKTLATNFNAARNLVLDPSDDSVWIAGGNNIFQLDVNGKALAGFSTPSTVQDIALAQDQSLWVLGRNQLLHYAAPNGLLGSAALAGDMQQANYLALDDANGVLWLGGAKQLFQIALALPVQPRLSLATSETIRALTLATDSGTLWTAGQSVLAGFTSSGAPAGQTSLALNNLVNPQTLVYDVPSQSLWLGHEKGISRFNAVGQYVGTLAASVKVSAISTTPSGIVPLLTLVTPAANALGNDPLIPIKVHYDATCFGQPCNYPPSVFAAYSLNATLNGQQIGSAFQFDATTGNASYTPSTRHAEGINSFVAFVTDSAGRRSKTHTSQFAIDTVAPRFTSVSPANGATFLTPNITLQGSIDDPLGRVYLDSYNGAAVSGPNPAGQNFSYAITLRPGTNAFRLTAGDPAGNANPLALNFVYSTLTLSITSPANGATVDSNKITVTGTFSGATNPSITVNGVAATINGTSFSAADIPLHTGSNTITVDGATSAGAHDSQTITVTSIAPSITISSPAGGATVNGNSVLVSGKIQAPANSGVMVNGVAAAINSAGVFNALVPVTQGANTITAILTAPSGATATQSLTVNASGQAPAIVAAADPVEGLAPLAVKFTVTNPTQSAASFTFDSYGPYSLPADGSMTLSLTYPAGVYTPSMVVTDGSGSVSTQRFVINALDETALDQQLRAIWNGMNTALIAGDKAKAMTYLNASAKAKYGPVFDALMPNYGAIISEWSPLARSSLSESMAEYGVVTSNADGRHLFLVYFLKGTDGVWRLESM